MTVQPEREEELPSEQARAPQDLGEGAVGRGGRGAVADEDQRTAKPIAAVPWRRKNPSPRRRGQTATPERPHTAAPKTGIAAATARTEAVALGIHAVHGNHPTFRAAQMAAVYLLLPVGVAWGRRRDTALRGGAPSESSPSAGMPEIGPG